MKIQFHGTSAVDIPGHDDVQPGQVVDVTDEVGSSLLAAGTAYPDDGAPVPARAPLWRIPAKKSANTPTETAEAGKEAS